MFSLVYSDGLSVLGLVRSDSGKGCYSIPVGNPKCSNPKVNFLQMVKCEVENTFWAAFPSMIANQYSSLCVLSIS